LLRLQVVAVLPVARLTTTAVQVQQIPAVVAAVVEITTQVAMVAAVSLFLNMILVSQPLLAVELHKVQIVLAYLATKYLQLQLPAYLTQ
jgi:hypothetical protein